MSLPLFKTYLSNQSRSLFTTVVNTQNTTLNLSKHYFLDVLNGYNKSIGYVGCL